MKSTFQRSLLLSAMMGLTAAAADSAGDVAPPLYRYLVVVDTSASMGRQKDGAAGAIGKLLATGINGRLQTGDLLGVWTIGDKLNKLAYGPKLWTDAERADIAGQILALVRDTRFSKAANLALMSDGIKEAAKASGSLTVLLVTDGSAPLRGTPFDDVINEIFQGHSAAMKKAKSPFIVVFNAQDGELISQAVSPGGGRIYIPPVRKRAADVALEQDLFGIKRPETNSPAQVNAAAKTNAPKTLSVLEISEILMKQQAARTNEATVVASSSVETNVPGSVTNVEPKPTATATAAAAPPVATVPPPTPANAPAFAQSTPAVENVKSPDSAIAVAASSNVATSPVESVRPTAEGTGEKPAATLPAQDPVVVLTVSPSEMSRRYLMMAGSLLVVALLLGWLLIRWRRPRSSPSLITRSLREREKH